MLHRQVRTNDFLSETFESAVALYSSDVRTRHSLQNVTYAEIKDLNGKY